MAEVDTGAPGYTSHMVFDVPPKEPAKVINGVKFEHGITGGAAAGHGIFEDVYRNFHDGKCYELTIAWTYSEAEADPPAFDSVAGAAYPKRTRRHSLLLQILALNPKAIPSQYWNSQWFPITGFITLYKTLAQPTPMKSDKAICHSSFPRKPACVIMDSLEFPLFAASPPAL